MQYPFATIRDAATRYRRGLAPRPGPGCALQEPGSGRTYTGAAAAHPDRGSGSRILARRSDRLAACAVLLMMAVTAARAELSSEELAKIAQNPLGNIVSLPFQNNTNLNYGPLKGTQNILNIQPVIPFEVNQDWNIITRTILPVIAMPALSSGIPSQSGVGDTTLAAWLSPARKEGWIWGLGPTLQAPTHSEKELGNGNWGLGPSAILVHLDKQSPWVFGILVNTVWSLSSDGHGGAYSHGVIQPGINYNFSDGLYLTSSPIMTVDWRASSSQRWTIPVGGGIGKIVHLGRLPLNLQLSGYYSAVRPDFASNWEIRAQMQFMFPK